MRLQSLLLAGQKITLFSIVTSHQIAGHEIVEAIIVGPLSRSVSVLRHHIPELSQVIIVLAGISIQVVMEAIRHPQGPELVSSEFLDEITLISEVGHILEFKISIHRHSPHNQ